MSLLVQAELSLEWALSSHGHLKRLNGENMYKCEMCCMYCQACRWWELAALPDMLTMHLKLFAFDPPLSGGGAKKPVSMPCPLRLKMNVRCSRTCEQWL